MNVGLVTLGCSKNQVDSEMLLGLFKKYNMKIVNSPEDADMIVVNTCGFIESAKIEAIDTILEMAEYKIYGTCKYLIVTGCLAKRYKKEILKSMPEVDLCIGVDEYENIDEILSKFLNQECLNRKLDFKERVVSTKFPLSYIRISDGCDNRCSYCAIPMIRGNFKSRPMEDILQEVEIQAKQGISEFCVISQDTSKYGKDIYGELKLAELLNKMSQVEGVKWIRVLYMYLFETTDELIKEMINNEKVCNYFDIPIQHASNKILKSMNRFDTKEIIYDRVAKIRSMDENAVLRTTVITGFPDETDEDFETLLTAIKDLKFDRLGAFAYSKEEGTKAATLENQIDNKIKNERLKKVFEVQKEISLSQNEKRLGKEYEVLVEDVSEDDKYFVCRSMFEAPDVDGKIYIEINEETSNKVIIGDYFKAKIIDYNDYDLFAKLV